jgi:hypothetical protein
LPTARQATAQEGRTSLCLPETEAQISQRHKKTPNHVAYDLLHFYAVSQKRYFINHYQDNRLDFSLGGPTNNNSSTMIRKPGKVRTQMYFSPEWVSNQQPQSDQIDLNNMEVNGRGIF